jgi:hypothetical protein
VWDNVGLNQNFVYDGNLDELTGLKPSKFKILDIHESPTDKK